MEEKKSVEKKINTYFKATQKLILGQIAYAKAQMGNPSEELETAMNLMNQAWRQNRDDKTILYNYGVVLGIIREDQLKELTDFEERTKKSLQQNPNAIQEYLNLAIVYENLAADYERNGEYEEAKKVLAKASVQLEELLKRAPNRLEVYIILGPLYQRQGRYKDALRTYERLERRDAKLPVPIFAAMATLHLELDNIDTAKEYAQKGVDADANSWRSHYILGKVYHAMNQPDKQVEHYTKALKVIEAEIPQTSDPNSLLYDKEQIQNELKEIQK